MTDSRTPIADEVRTLRNGNEEAPPVIPPRGAAPAGVLQVGSAFPATPLLTVGHAETTVHKTRHGRAGVIVFYRGSWCPYCNLTLRTYRQLLAQVLWNKDIAFIAVSPLSSDESLSFAEKLDLEFDVLSDPGSALGKALGITYTPTDDHVSALSANGVNLAAINEDHSVDLPHPTVALVGTTGELLWIDVHTDYTTRTEPADILEALDRLVH